MKREFSRQIFEKRTDIKFYVTPSCGNQVVPCGQKEGRAGGQIYMTKLIVAFRNFGKAHKNNISFIT